MCHQCKKYYLNGFLGVNFTDILRVAFLYKSFAQSFLHLHFRFELLLAKEYWRKSAYKMLVKLTLGTSQMLLLH